MKSKFTFLVVLSFIFGSLFAQTPDKAKLDQYFQALESGNKFMGCVSISKDGKTVYSKAVGFADAENGKKLNETSKFRIGSISKMFTATLVFKAIDDKKLNLDDKLDKWFPSVPNASKITIGNLLNHHSGIHNLTNDPDYQTYMSTTKTEAELVAIIAGKPSDFEPGSKGEYSNSNTILLSFILEKTLKKPYRELLAEKIVKPLGLKNTYYGSKISVAGNEAESYAFIGGKWQKQPETDMSIPMGAGAIVSNVPDLSRFIEALFAGKLVSAASLEKMKTDTDGYGMGMFKIQLPSVSGYGHNGGIDGFASTLVYFPEDKVSVAILSNGSGYDIESIGLTVVNWFSNQPITIPDFTSQKYTADELNAFTGVYSTPAIPLKITITSDGQTLSAQATGQSAFPLDSAERNVFRFDMAGIVLEFKPSEKKMLLKQSATIEFTKE